MNTYDTGLLQKRLGQFSGQGPKVFVLNSCAVTSEATQQVLREARRLKRTYPDGKVVVTGCSAQVDTELLSHCAEIDLIVANSHKGQLREILSERLRDPEFARVHKSNIFNKEDVEFGGGEELGHTRSFLKIQDGCNSFCTFCVIPFARGKSRSISVEDLVQKIKQLEEKGVREVVLTGVHIGDYSDENEHRLEDLVEAVLKNTKMPRLRLSSLEPVELSDRLIELFSDDRMCAHFHMSIQSGSTSVLTKMKRQYSAKAVQDSLFKIQNRCPEAFVGMDVIAGFPEESENEFADTYKLLSESPWTRLHVFPYSERPLTYAARAFEKVDQQIVKARALRLRELSHERLMKAALQQIGKIKHCLVLKSGKALSRDYWSVSTGSADLTVGSEVKILILGCDRQVTRQGDVLLYGEVGPILA